MAKAQVPSLVSLSVNNSFLTLSPKGLLVVRLGRQVLDSLES